MRWLINARSQLSLDSKLRPIWTKRDRAMGMQQAIQHQDPPNIPVKNAQNDHQFPPVRLQPKRAQ